MHPRAQPGQLGGSPWPRELGSGRPKGEAFFFTLNLQAQRLFRFDWEPASRSLRAASADDGAEWRAHQRQCVWSSQYCRPPLPAPWTRALCAEQRVEGGFFRSNVCGSIKMPAQCTNVSSEAGARR